MENNWHNAIQLRMAHIFNLHKMKDCYLLRIHLLKNDYQNKSEFEKNEVNIKEIESQSAVLKLNDQLREKLKDFYDTWTIYEFALKE